MENTKRMHKVYDHPYLGALVAYFLVSGFAMLPAFFAPIFEFVVATADGQAIAYLAIGLFSLIALLIHRLWFRKDGYRGCFTCSKFNHNDVWTGIIIILVLDVGFFIFDALTRTGDGPRMVLPTISNLMIAIYAGTYEETCYRAIPVSIIMKNSPTRGRMWSAAFLTSAVFGLVHLANMSAGAGLQITIVQVIVAFCLGMLFSAIYIRTGNILITMVLHTIHDIIAFMVPGQSTGVMLRDVTVKDLICNGIYVSACLIVAICLLRKSKWEEIKATWANIWAE